MAIERAVKQLIEAADLPDGLRAELLASLAQRSAPLVDGSQIRNLLVDEGMLQDLAVAVNKLAEPVAFRAQATQSGIVSLTIDPSTVASTTVFMPEWAGVVAITAIATGTAFVIEDLGSLVGVQATIGGSGASWHTQQTPGGGDANATSVLGRNISAPGSSVVCTCRMQADGPTSGFGSVAAHASIVRN